MSYINKEGNFFKKSGKKVLTKGKKGGILTEPLEGAGLRGLAKGERGH